MKNHLRFVSIAILAFWMLVSLIGTAVSAEAIDFTLKDINGGSVSLSSYKGKVPVLLLFWTTWCPYCRSALKELNNMQMENKGTRVEVLAIDVGEPQSAVSRLAKNLGLQLQVLLDSDNTVADNYQVIGVPTYILLDKNGEVVFRGNSFPKNYQELVCK
ncbi:MAG: TlpA disulfide reductase family protein [Candidatus Omnitrophica bacterium]|nr:TlpA disulfide reductase family protein [Candidatus Omnitrophota bacterium]MDD5512842.1 TlpA disulfide reductase family protein [Candidatus Omnitrophota bacterium]